jgi:GMP synthase PP-ATPase subunit
MLEKKKKIVNRVILCQFEQNTSKFKEKIKLSNFSWYSTFNLVENSWNLTEIKHHHNLVNITRKSSSI